MSSSTELEINLRKDLNERTNLLKKGNVLEYSMVTMKIL